MPYHDPDHYLASPAFLRAQHFKRSLRTLYVSIDDVEPRGKKTMPKSDKLRFQRAVLQHLRQFKRRAFRVPLAVQVWLDTSEKNPSHPHTVAKNLLDLLARPLTGLGTNRNALVYHDDTQISALSVICRHGHPTPAIRVQVQPLRDLLDPLAEALLSGQEADDDNRWNATQGLAGDRNWLDDLAAHEEYWRKRLGSENYLAHVR